MNNRAFNIAQDGSIEITARISFTDFSELPTSIAHASADHISTDQTPQGKAGFVALLNVAALFLPDEIQQSKLIGEMCDRRKSKASAAPIIAPTASTAEIVTSEKSREFAAFAAAVEKRGEEKKATLGT